ncbi:VCBS repeat-containing protein [Sphaerisporangium album]|uniref:VCBS repeat-containing protein n=1 Tax=Sphaerisporangium album TaxID=509200 RepID=A0A367FDW4_9ACTN|nr:VCBS repeat-containing protein [Sphaerisporangium album]RCG27877.1 VCBS repeat-containing protein [Sphaerisporangium album]
MKLNRLVSGALGTMVAAAIGFTGTVVTSVATAAPAHAASSAGGQITRSEVLARAQHWVDQGYTYLNSSDKSTWRTGPTGGERYRRDCSGLISMVWHLTEGYYDTSVFESWIGGSRLTRLGSFNDLKPGDAVLRVNFKGLSDHTELFARWKNNANHSEGAYFYSFNSTGETVRNPSRNSNFGNLGFRSLNDITSNFEHAIHYNNVIEDPQTPPPVPQQLGTLGDFDGDGKQDIAGVAGGDLWIHRNTSTPGNFSTQGTFISSGWGTVGKFMAGDFDADGKDDIIGFNGGDELMIWRSTSTATTFSFAAYKSLGTGWGIFDKLLPLADYDGDGKKDIAGIAGSDLWIHRNTSTPGNFSTQGTFISSGWGTVGKFMAGDFDADGKDDIIGFNGGDELMIWRSTSTATTFSFAAYKSLGTGWGIFDKLLPLADYDGDGKKDIAGVAYSDLWIHRNTSTPGNFSTQGVFVSSGWLTVSKFLGADFDADGKSDIIGFNGGDELMIWRSSSNATDFGFAAYKSLGTGWGIFRQLLTSAAVS